MKYFLTIFIVFTIFVFALPATAQVLPGSNEAVFYLSPENGISTIGSTFPVELRVSAVSAITSIKAYLDFNPAMLSVASISTTDSVFPNWWENATTSGKIKLQASVPSPGFGSNDGLVATIIFRSIASGTTTVIYDLSSLALQPDDADIINILSSGEANLIISSPLPPSSPPVLAPIGNKSTDEGKLLSFILNAMDADGDALIYSAIGLPTGATLVGQIFNWTPNFTQAGIYNITLSVTDGKGGIDSEAITITIKDVNQPPVLAIIGDKFVDEGKLLSFTVVAADPDGDKIVYSVRSFGIDAEFNSVTGVFFWTPGFTKAGIYSATFIAKDGRGGADFETISITVNNVR